jgi:hypothetical protein
MNPNAAIFYPKLYTQEVYSQTISRIPYMSSVIEDLLFDNLENDFIKNNSWLFEDVIEETKETEEKTFTVKSRKGKIIITLKPKKL